MRNLMLLAALFSPLALAQAVIEVAPHGVMRLPTTASTLHIERLRIAEHGTLLIPANLTEMRIAELHLGRDARIAIAPAEQAFRLEVASGEIASGAQISARGAQGSSEQPALPGRNLSLRLQVVTVESLLVDARGGNGAPGYAGLAGANGKPGGCTWGEASRGHDGLDGGDGQPGAGEEVTGVTLQDAAHPTQATVVQPTAPDVQAPRPRTGRGAAARRVGRLADAHRAVRGGA